jgi:hypothetical protein
MTYLCPYCQLDTAGNHAIDCPYNRQYLVYAGTDTRLLTPQQICDLVAMYDTCEPGGIAIDSMNGRR